MTCVMYEPGNPSRIIGADMLVNECAVSVVEVLGQWHGVNTGLVLFVVPCFATAGGRCEFPFFSVDIEPPSCPDVSILHQTYLV